MKARIKKASIEFLVIYLFLALIFGVLVMMYLRISRTSDESAIEILHEKKQFVIKDLDLFFKPIQERLEEEHSFIYLHGKNKPDSALQVYRAFSMVKSNEVISCMVIADTCGTQEYFGKLTKANRWYYIKTHLGNKTDRLPDVKRWYQNGSEFIPDTVYVKKSDYDPRERPWFKNAMKNSERIWTEPYMFATSNLPGITLSKYVKTLTPRIVVFDIRLESLSLKTSNINVSPNGFAFLITDSAKIIGLPDKVYANSSDSIKKFALKDLHILGDTLLTKVFEEWKKLNKANFKININEKNYWAEFSPYSLGNVTFYAGVVAPENEIIGSLIKTKNLLFYGLIMILIFSVFTGYAYRQKLRSNKQLNEKNLVIENQKLIVDQKNREIIDSITYARRIQRASLTSETYIARVLQKLKS